MRFRRIYWTLEQFNGDGSDDVVGIYTSIHDLVECGLPMTRDAANGYRFTLCELDCACLPIASFRSPDFDGIDDLLNPLIQNGEISKEEFAELRAAVRA